MDKGAVLLYQAEVLVDHAKKAAADKEYLTVHRYLNGAQRFLLGAAGHRLGIALGDVKAARAAVASAASAARSETARKGGKAKHDKSPKAAAKKFVRECWESWVLDPGRYPGATAFARDMLDKQPALISAATIENWVSAWRKGSL